MNGETKRPPEYSRGRLVHLFAGDLRACQLVASLSKSRNKSKVLEAEAEAIHEGNVFVVIGAVKRTAN